MMADVQQLGHAKDDKILQGDTLWYDLNFGGSGLCGQPYAAVSKHQHIQDNTSRLQTKMDIRWDLTRPKQ